MFAHLLKRLSFALGLLLIFPIVFVYLAWSDPHAEHWQHLLDTNLGLYFSNTLVLVLGVGLGTMLLGVSCAWCMVHSHCYAKRWLQIGLLLPLAMPAYIIAYTYTGILDPAQANEIAHWIGQIGDIRSLFGAILMLSLVLFPYVYILTYNAFRQHACTYTETSQSLGLSSWQYMLKIALPLSRPAIFAGVALAMMEALADYGTVAYFGVSTLTTGIFRIWFGMGEASFASQLASILATIVLLVLLLEQFQRRKLQYYQNKQSQKAPSFQVSRVQKTIVTFYLWCVVALGFLIPTIQLVTWASTFVSQTDWTEYGILLWQTLCLGFVAGAVIVTIALLFAYSERFYPRSVFRYLSQFTALGYAIPGVVIAVGVMTPLGWLDIQINELWYGWYNEYLGLIFSGTIFALVLAYCVRFMNIAKQNIGNALLATTPSYDDAVMVLGRSRWALFLKVHLPILRPALLSAFVLVFVDVLKELPATLILRPFNFNTFAVKAFEYASDERLTAAALPAVSIVFAGLIPLYFILKNIYSEDS